MYRSIASWRCVVSDRFRLWSTALPGCYPRYVAVSSEVEMGCLARAGAGAEQAVPGEISDFKLFKRVYCCV